MSVNSLQNGDRSSGFKESLRFFQSQVSKTSCPPVKDVPPNSKKVYTIEPSEIDLSNHSPNSVIYKTSNAVPSVDNILSNVKTLCAARYGKVASDESSSVPRVHRDELDNKSVPRHRNELDNKSGPVCLPTVYNSRNVQRSEGVTRSEQVSVSSKSIVSDRKRHLLLSNFNPTFDPDEKEQGVKHNPLFDESDQICDAVNKEATTVRTVKTNSLARDFEQKLCFQNINVTSCLKTATKKDSDTNSNSHSHSINSNTDPNPAANRTFGQCKTKLELARSQPKQPGSDAGGLPKPDVETNENDDVDDDQSEKPFDSFESDYDSQDFVVHKANFPEDYLEAMSEDNYSSVNEDYPGEEHRSPDIPSPDYVSEDEEYTVQAGDDVQEYDDVEFIDNTAQYVNDPRRFVYYDDKELEVIPEEDEEDIEEDEGLYNHESYRPRGFAVSNPSSDDSRYTGQGECDSGLTDDQRSAGSSTAEDCDLEDDTDSAQGSSLPRQDSSSGESPTNGMFPSGEARRKGRKRDCRRVVEDYEKPKVNGRDVERLSTVHQGAEDEEARQARNTTGSWDPQELLKVLYRLDAPTEPLKKTNRYLNKEGYLEKLPSGRKKATYWNPWKSKYIRLKDGFLYCYDNNRSEKPSMTMQLMGGHVDSLESKMIGVDDQKGHYIVLRCSTDDEMESWANALQSHCIDDFANAYTSPCLRPLKISKNIVIVDLGSCSVRAGILMSSPSLPQLFFPTVCATNKFSQKKIFGSEALKPNVRKDSILSFPLHSTAKVTKYSIDVSVLPDLLKHVFHQLNIHPDEFQVQLSMPRNLSLQTKLKVASMLLDDFRVKGINLTHQAILSLHAYNSKSGIIVDIGDRLDVIPIIEGYIVESGVTRLPYGGQRMIHHLKHALAEKNISVVSDVETYIARYVLEQLCYVAEDFNEELQRFHTNPDDFEMSVSTSHFFKEDNKLDEVVMDLARFNVPEGLFNPEKWGIDNPGLHKLVHHAIQECGVDLRREMARSIYISGGLTLLPGFTERLENEVNKLTPNTITPKVHASPYRYHMSYIGACQIALGEKFDDICLTKQIWKREGNTCVKKWHI